MKYDNFRKPAIYLYSAYKSKKSLGASVVKEMCFKDRLKESPGRRSPRGRSFHSWGPAAEKLLSPSLLWRWT